MPFNVHMERSGVYTFLVPHLQRNACREMDEMQRLPYKFQQLFRFFMRHMPYARQNHNRQQAQGCIKLCIQQRQLLFLSPDRPPW